MGALIRIVATIVVHDAVVVVEMSKEDVNFFSKD